MLQLEEMIGELTCLLSR